MTSHCSYCEFYTRSRIDRFNFEIFRWQKQSLEISKIYLEISNLFVTRGGWMVSNLWLLYDRTSRVVVHLFLLDIWLFILCNTIHDYFRTYCTIPLFIHHWPKPIFHNLIKCLSPIYLNQNFLLWPPYSIVSRPVSIESSVFPCFCICFHPTRTFWRLSNYTGLKFCGNPFIVLHFCLGTCLRSNI